MPVTVQARLDDETSAILKRLARTKGWTSSRIVREGIHLLAREQNGSAASRMVGIGIFASGVSDMGSNKKYLEGFGENSGIDRGRSKLSKRKAG
ncbi:MAG: CopG family transcriptional regulator [Terracidiphilus sp.]